MGIFAPENCFKSEKHKKICTICEIAYTSVDVSAAISFVIGSVMFFFTSWETEGTWFFFLGSALFAVKPLIRFAREA